jgi:hypothetical protein
MEYRFCPNMIVIDTPGMLHPPKVTHCLLSYLSIVLPSFHTRSFLLLFLFLLSFSFLLPFLFLACLLSLHSVPSNSSLLSHHYTHHLLTSSLPPHPHTLSHFFTTPGPPIDPSATGFSPGVQGSGVPCTEQN